MLAIAVLFFFSPQLLAAMDRQFVLGNWIGYALAAVGLISGVMLTYDSMQPYALGIHDHGITWTAGKHTTEFHWADISAVRLERKPKEAKPTVLTVWTSDAVRYDVAPDEDSDGYRRYHVADLGMVVESRKQIEEGLRRYAGELYLPAN